LVLFFISHCGTAAAGSIESKWGAPLVSPIGLKEIIISTLDMKNQPDFKSQMHKVSKPTANFMNDIDVATFLYAYDSFSSKRDIEDLASLDSYYLGEANGVLYRCLVLRKGMEIMPALKKLASKSSNECIDRFGSQSNICVSDKEYRSTLAYYISTITKLSKTNSTEAGCTTADWGNM
jgi:hypothetical protein